MYSGYPFHHTANPSPPPAHPMRSSPPSSYYHFPEPVMHTTRRPPAASGPPPAPWPGMGSLYPFPFPYPYPYPYPSHVDVGAAYAYSHGYHPMNSNNDSEGNSNKIDKGARSSREGSNNGNENEKGKDTSASASASSSHHDRDRVVVVTERDVKESLNEASAPECGKEGTLEGSSEPKQTKAKADGASDDAEKKSGGPPMYHQRFPFPFQPYYAMPFPGPGAMDGPSPLPPGASFPFPCPPPPPPSPFSMFYPHAQGKDGAPYPFNPHLIPPFAPPPFSAPPPPLPNYHPLHPMHSMPKEHPYHAHLNDAVQSLNKMGAVGVQQAPVSPSRSSPVLSPTTPNQSTSTPTAGAANRSGTLRRYLPKGFYNRYLWWKIAYAVRMSVIGVLPVAALIASESVGDVAFASKTFATCGALLTALGTFGGAVDATWAWMKAIPMTVPLLTLFTYLELFHDPYAWAATYCLMLTLCAFCCDGLCKRLAMLNTTVVMVAMLRARYDGVGKGMHVEFPARLAAEYTLGCITGILSTLIPFPRLATRRVDKKLSSAANNLNQAFSGLCDTFWTSSNMERRLNMVRIQFAKKTALENLQDANALLQVCRFEPQTLERYYLRLAKIEFLQQLPPLMDSTLRLLEVIADDPSLVDSYQKKAGASSSSTSMPRTRFGSRREGRPPTPPSSAGGGLLPSCPTPPPANTPRGGHASFLEALKTRKEGGGSEHRGGREGDRRGGGTVTEGEAFGHYLSNALLELASAVDSALFLIGNANTIAELQVTLEDEIYFRESGRRRERREGLDTEGGARGRRGRRESLSKRGRGLSPSSRSPAETPTANSPALSPTNRSSQIVDFSSTAGFEESSSSIMNNTSSRVFRSMSQQELDEGMARRTIRREEHPVLRVKYALLNMEATYARARREILYNVVARVRYGIGESSSSTKEVSPDAQSASRSAPLREHAGNNNNSTAHRSIADDENGLRYTESFSIQRHAIAWTTPPLQDYQQRPSPSSAADKSNASGDIAANTPTASAYPSTFEMSPWAQDFVALMSYYMFTLTQIARRTAKFPSVAQQKHDAKVKVRYGRKVTNWCRRAVRKCVPRCVRRVCGVGLKKVHRTMKRLSPRSSPTSAHGPQGRGVNTMTASLRTATHDGGRQHTDHGHHHRIRPSDSFFWLKSWLVEDVAGTAWSCILQFRDLIAFFLPFACLVGGGVIREPAATAAASTTGGAMNKMNADNNSSNTNNNPTTSPSSLLPVPLRRGPIKISYAQRRNVAVRFRESFKVSLACCLCILFFYFMDRRFAFYGGPAIIAFIASNTASEAISASLIRILGAPFGCVVGFFCSQFTDTPLEKVLGLVLLTCICSFFRTGKQYGTAAVYANFVIVPLMLPNMTSDEAISRIMQITFGAMIYSAISAVFFPTDPEYELQRARSAAMLAMRDYFKKIMDAVVAPLPYVVEKEEEEEERKEALDNPSVLETTGSDKSANVSCQAQHEERGGGTVSQGGVFRAYVVETIVPVSAASINRKSGAASGVAVGAESAMSNSSASAHGEGDMPKSEKVKTYVHAEAVEGDEDIWEGEEERYWDDVYGNAFSEESDDEEGEEDENEEDADEEKEHNADEAKERVQGGECEGTIRVLKNGEVTVTHTTEKGRDATLLIELKANHQANSSSIILHAHLHVRNEIDVEASTCAVTINPKPEATEDQKAAREESIIVGRGDLSLEAVGSGPTSAVAAFTSNSYSNPLVDLSAYPIPQKKVKEPFVCRPTPDAAMSSAQSAAGPLVASLQQAATWMPFAETELTVTRIPYPASVGHDLNASMIKMRSLTDLMSEALRTIRQRMAYSTASGGTAASASAAAAAAAARAANHLGLSFYSKSFLASLTSNSATREGIKRPGSLQTDPSATAEVGGGVALMPHYVSPSPLFLAVLTDLCPLAMECSRLFTVVSDMVVASLTRRNANMVAAMVAASLAFEEACIALREAKSLGFQQLVKLSRIISDEVHRGREEAKGSSMKPSSVNERCGLTEKGVAVVAKTIIIEGTRTGHFREGDEIRHREGGGLVAEGATRGGRDGDDLTNAADMSKKDTLAVKETNESSPPLHQFVGGRFPGPVWTWSDLQLRALAKAIAAEVLKPIPLPMEHTDTNNPQSLVLVPHSQSPSFAVVRKLKLLLSNADALGMHTLTLSLVIFAKELKRIVMSVEWLQQYMVALEQQ